MTPEDIAAEVRRIEITTRHLVRDIVAGEYSSAFRGTGVEFAEVREYQPGDDIRTIDWNVTARLGSAYVKRYLEERELTVMFLLDYSASSGFGTTVRTKRDLAVEACSVLALAAARNNDRVGAVGFTDRAERFVPPRRGRRQVLRVVSELIGFEPGHRGTDLTGALEFLASVLRRRSVVFVASDFYARGYDVALEQLARRHDVIALQVVDPREREMPAVGMAAFVDPETGGWRWVDTDDAALRERYRLSGARFDAELEQTLRLRDVDHLRLETGRSYAETFIAFFRRRERMLWR
ncbi:MAG: DUF58 domain-containing protein [Gemmatimonadales bacterium]|nr:DUF58 domain-containing protein [Gemmatimonadales bacterium]